MRLSRALARCLPIVLACLSQSSRSRAELLVVVPPGSPAALAHAEVAFATGEGTPVTWLSLRVRRGPVAVVAALSGSASWEPAPDAWLAALEQTASPNVLLPHGATNCGASSGFVHVAWPRTAGMGAEELALSEPEDVVAALEEHGLGEGLELPVASRYLVWAWPARVSDETTRTLRISGDSGSLSFWPPSTWPVLVSCLSPHPLGLPGELGSDRLRVTFFAGKPSTDYLEQAASWTQREEPPLLEARASGTIFGWSVLAGAVSMPPLVRSYARAAARERDDVDPDRCTEQLQAFQDGDAPSATACGSATDASLAFAATGARPVLQRFVVTASAPLGAGSFRDGGDVSPPVLRASAIDVSECPLQLGGEPPVVVPPSPVGGGTPAPHGGATSVVVEETVVAEDPYPSESCSCSPGRDPYYREDRSSTVYCSGDTSSSASDDSCSSDSSSSSGDDSCSSDSSSSSGDDSCSSDSSSSSGDDSCSGSTDSSYDGDTCTGRAAPAAEPESAQASSTSLRTGRPRRLRLSLGALALSAVLLPIRRRKRAAAP
jgi:hypothetical protein